jgi:hypothetical protein
MARLPTAFDLGQRPSPQPESSVVTLRPAPAETGPGLALVHAGNEFTDQAKELYHLAKVEKTRIDATKADEAYNKFRDAQTDLETGEGGFANKKGGAVTAANFRKDYLAKVDEAMAKAQGDLTNDDQRALFNKHAAVARRQFNEGLSRHMGHQADVYQKQTYEASKDVELRSIVSKWSDMSALEVSLARMSSLIEREAERSGWSPEMKADERMKVESRVHAAVIGQALASNNLTFAQNYFQANKEGIDVQTAKVLEKAVEDGTQKQLFNGYQTDYLGSQNSGKGLAALERRVTADKVLDESRKNVLIGRIQGRQDVLDRRAIAAQERWERNTQRAIDKVNNLTLSGYEPTAEQMQPLVDATKGTHLAGEVQQMIAVANGTRQFRMSTPPQQEAMITQLETEARKDPTKFDVTVINRFKSIHEAQKRDIKADPITFAVRQGLIDSSAPAAQPLDLSKPDALGPQLQARFELMRGVQGKYNAPAKPLTEEEATLLSETLKKANPEQKSQYFAQLSKASGGDYPAYKAMMQQIAPDDPVTAMAGIYAGRNAQTDKAKSVSNYMLRGQQILHPNKKEDGTPTKGMLPMPPDKDMMQAFSSYEKDAFTGHEQTRNANYQAARAIYAALSVEQGDFSGELKSRRWEGAIELATGGIDTYKGKAVVLPYGYTGSMFNDGVKERIDALVASGRVDDIAARKIRSLPLENIGDGRYMFRAGDAALIGKDKKPLIVDFNVPLPQKVRPPISEEGMAGVLAP